MPETRVHGYVRVSSKEQNEARQVTALKAFGISERDIYIDKISGKNFDRPEYNRLLNVIRRGDLLVVLSLDRLGRNYTEIQNQWRYIVNGLSADIKVLDMPLLDTRTVAENLDSRFVSDLVLQILSYVSQKERENLRERQAQGIAHAKAQGKNMGRPKIEYPSNWNEIYTLWDRQEITAKEAMEQTGLKRNTFYKLAKNRREKASGFSISKQEKDG